MEHSTKYVTSTTQNCQGHKENMKSCHSIEYPKET